MQNEEVISTLRVSASFPYNRADDSVLMCAFNDIRGSVVWNGSWHTEDPSANGSPDFQRREEVSK
jgi:hypothetical protein